MTRVMSATDARIHFGELLRRVENGDTVVVQRGGKPQAVVLSIEAYERLRRSQVPQEDWWELAERSRALMRQHLNGRPFPDVDRLFAEMREERDAQLLENLR